MQQLRMQNKWLATASIVVDGALFAAACAVIIFVGLAL
jgi:hypothetical protein